MDKRGQHWKKLSQKERSAIGRKAANTRKRNALKRQELTNKDGCEDGDELLLVQVIASVGLDRSQAILDAMKTLKVP